jgi:hypothetical protein
MVAIAFGAIACSMPEEPLHHHPSHGASAQASAAITVAPRTPLLPTYPCSRCHDSRAPDPRERKLVEFHTQRVLSHGDAKGWCYRCHTKDNIDKLHEPDGTLVSFDEAYLLCGSCHGDKLRDWRLGIHGLNTGYWNGPRLRHSCTFCHDPHSPRFAPMTPEHMPARPRTEPATGPEPPEDTHGEGH